MKKIGFDIDGTITSKPCLTLSRMRIPCPLIRFAIKLYCPEINERVVNLIKIYKKRGDKVILISSRPKKVKLLTKKYLIKKGIPFDEILFVGNGPNAWIRKVIEVRKAEIDIFYDDDEKVIQALKKNRIKSILVIGEDFS